MLCLSLPSCGFMPDLRGFDRKNGKMTGVCLRPRNVGEVGEGFGEGLVLRLRPRHRVRVFVEEAVGAGALAVQEDVGAQFGELRRGAG